MSEPLCRAALVRASVAIRYAAVSTAAGRSGSPSGASTDTPDGDDGPPTLVLMVSGVLGLVSVVCAVAAWRSGNRLAVRINAAALIINALLTMPAFFVDIAAWVKVGATVSVLLTVVALVLTLRREPTPYTVTD